MKKASHIGMVQIPGGMFVMGSDRFYPEEAPARKVRVDPFWIDETPVTNAQFAQFVEATGHLTFAELSPDPHVYVGLDPALAQPGSLVFTPPAGPVSLTSLQWWAFEIGADWRHPHGADSDLDGLEDHPVVHVTWADARAYAKWAGKKLPTEAQWECAARGGLDGADYAWGDELAPSGKLLANYWQGPFPHANSLADGWERTSPVRTYPANGYGVYDMIGNVWEWTIDWYAQSEYLRPRSACCIPANPRGGLKQHSVDPHDPLAIPRKVMKGGSHLCAEEYCQRYRPASRHPQPIDTSTSHVGFRCVR